MAVGDMITKAGVPVLGPDVQPRQHPEPEDPIADLIDAAKAVIRSRHGDPGCTDSVNWCAVLCCRMDDLATAVIKAETAVRP